MYSHTFPKLANYQIRRQAPHIKWAVSLVIACGHFLVKKIAYFPLYILDTGNINPIRFHNKLNHGKDKRIKWSKTTNDDIVTYGKNTERHLSNIQLNHELLLCDNVECTVPAHIKAIDRMYKDVVNALQTASCFLREQVRPHFKQIPGWGDVCADLHSSARDAFLLWRTNGKPRNGPIHNIMKTSRARFKYALRQCKRDRYKHQANKIAQNLLSHDPKNFWKEIKKVMRQDQFDVLADTIDGHTGSQEIAEMWRNKFSKLLNSTGSHRTPEAQKDRYTRLDEKVSLSPLEIITAIKKQKKDKKPGRDNLQGEHLLYAHDKLSVMLSLIFNAMFLHAHVPESFMDTIIIPLVKDKKESLQSSDNYRPIALTSTLSKVLETIILERYKAKLESSPHQFGYKPKHGTELSIFVLKQVIEYYQAHSSPVFLCFMDLSKAFDRVDHVTLFKKLQNHDLPSQVIRLLKNWYATQKFYVRWE